MFLIKKLIFLTVNASVPLARGCGARQEPHLPRPLGARRRWQDTPNLRAAEWTLQSNPLSWRRLNHLAGVDLLTLGWEGKGWK